MVMPPEIVLKRKEVAKLEGKRVSQKCMAGMLYSFVVRTSEASVMAVVKKVRRREASFIYDGVSTIYSSHRSFDLVAPIYIARSES